MAAADRFLEVMDRFWFHQIILFTGSTTSQLVPKTLAEHQLMITREESFASCPSPSSSSISLATLPDEEFSSITSPLPEDDHQISPPESPPTSLLNESSNEEDNNDVSQQKERPTRSNFVTSRARSQPSSPSSTQKRSKNMRCSSSLRNLPKSTSFKTLGELELEEVKGFMDLGFVFKKESLSPRMMSILPGLQRLEVPYGNEHNTTNHHKDNELVVENDKLIREEKEEEERGIVRPYLSEAWLIKKPDSPLLNLRVPRASAAADMREHLKFWARTVASVIQLES